MSRLSLLGVLALAFAPLVALAYQFQDREQAPIAMQSQPLQSGEWMVRIKGADDQSLTGKVRLQTIGVDSDLGRHMIKPEKVKAIQFSSEEENEEESSAQPGRSFRAPSMTIQGTVIATTGDQIQGSIQVGTWQVDTSLGTLLLDLKKIKEVEFLHESEEAEAEEPETDDDQAEESNEKDSETESDEPEQEDHS